MAVDQYETFADTVMQDCITNLGFEDVTYNVASPVSAEAIKGMFVPEVATVEKREDGTWWVLTATLFISYDATAGIAAPALDDTVTVRGESWAVAVIHEKTGGTWTLSLRRSTRDETAIGDYRRFHR